MKTITGKTKAWIPQYSSVGPEALKSEKCIGMLAYSAHDMSTQGWTLVGEAEVTLHIEDEKTIIANKVSALKEELKTVRAEAEMKANQIQSRINDLLAIAHEPEKNNE